MGVLAQNISCQGWDAYTGHDCTQDLADGFRVMLETVIVKSGKIDVVERSQLDGVLQEQAIGQEGLTTRGGQLGGLTGVDYLVYGSITRFGTRQESTKITGGSGVGGFLGRRSGGAFSGTRSAKLTTEMAVDLKITDVSTGRIILADTVKGEAEQGRSVHISGIQSSNSAADPFADVQRIVASRLAEAIVTSQIPIKVIQIQDDGGLILNYGEVFLNPGDQLTLYEVGEQIVDPDTGEVLGEETTPIGSVKVESVEERFSRARAAGDFPVEVGSVLKKPDQEN